MKKGLGKIRKIKKKHIFLALLAVIVLGGLAKAYSAWVGTTRIAFRREKCFFVSIRFTSVKMSSEA